MTHTHPHTHTSIMLHVFGNLGSQTHGKNNTTFPPKNGRRFGGFHIFRTKWEASENTGIISYSRILSQRPFRKFRFFHSWALNKMGGPPEIFRRSGTRSSIFLGLPASWVPWGSSFRCLRGEVAAPEAPEVAAPTEASVTEPPETSVPAPTETSLPVGTEVGGTTTAEEWGGG